MSEEKYPKIVEAGINHKTLALVWPDGSYSYMPDRLTAERCVAAEEMEELLRDLDGMGVVVSIPWIEKRDALLKRLEDARCATDRS